MRLVALKGIEGKLEFKDMPQADLVDWFKSNTDDEGNVTDEIILYNHGIFAFSKEEKADKDGIPFTLSTFDLDRDSERIDQTGWDLKNFKANPVVLWSHFWDQPAIAKMNSVRIKDGDLKGKVQFVQKEIDEFGWSIGQKVELGFLNTGSVGFKPKKVEIVEDEKDPTRVIHRKQELYEFSIVNLPSNTSARVERGADPDLEVARAVGRAEMTRIDAEDWGDDVREEAWELATQHEIKNLKERVETLEHKEKDYIAAVMDLPRETSEAKARETSDALKQFKPVVINPILTGGNHA